MTASLGVFEVISARSMTTMTAALPFDPSVLLKFDAFWGSSKVMSEIAEEGAHMIVDWLKNLQVERRRIYRN